MTNIQKQNVFWVSLCWLDLVEKTREGEAMACARVPLDELQVTEPGPLGKEHTLPALVSHITSFYTEIHSNSSPWCSRNNLTCLSRRSVYQNQTMCFLFHISTRPGRRSAALCLTSHCLKTALRLRWRSFWNMPNSSQRTWSGCSHCRMTSSGVRWGSRVNISLSHVCLSVHLPTKVCGCWVNVNKCKCTVDSVTAVRIVFPLSSL